MYSLKYHFDDTQIPNFFSQWSYRGDIVSPGYNQVKKKLANNYTNTHKKTRFQCLKTGFSLNRLMSDMLSDRANTRFRDTFYQLLMPVLISKIA